MRYLIGVISVLVVVVLVGSVMVPIINDSATGGVEYEDNSDWDGWVRFDLNVSPTATYHLGMWQDEDGIYVDNITSNSLDRQIYDDSATAEYETIMYADTNTVIWSFDDTFNAMGKVNGSFETISGNIFDVIRSADGVTITTATDAITFDAPAWAYVPLSTGAYGFYFYDEGRGVEHPANAPVAAFGGGNVGVYAYNDIYTYEGLGLEMSSIIEDGLYYGATWARAEPVVPDDVTITPLDPSVIGGGDVGTNPVIPIDDPFDPEPYELLAVPTPTYTDGDWGYDLMTVDNVQYAKLVSYSGTGGNIIVPATVNGIDVYQIGKGGSSNVIMDNSNIAANSTITFTDGPKVIGSYAFDRCTNLTGSLVLPSTVTTLSSAAFRDCSGFTGSLILPDRLTNIQNYVFSGCTGFTGSLILPDTVIQIGSSAFSDCRGFTGSLVLPPNLTTIGNTAFYNCYGFNDTLVIPDSITSLGTGFYNLNFKGVVIASDFTPASNNLLMYQVTEVLDLSDTIDYNTDRNGLPAAATVYDTIGDCLGFVSIVTTAHGSPGGLGQFSPLMYAIPLVVIGSLLVAFAAYIIRRDY